MRHHEQRRLEPHKFIGTIALVDADERKDFGTVRLSAENDVIVFEEKPPNSDTPGFINAGIYLFEPGILDLIPLSTKISLERHIFPALLAENYRIAGFPETGFFVDIGTPAGFSKFQRFIERGGCHDYSE
jgi:mannose-1-phosphate guanylyltransferase